MIVGLTVLHQLLRFSAISVFKFIPTKIHKTVATIAAPFGPDMHQIVCRLRLRPRPHCGSVPRSPRPSSWIKGPTSKGRGGKGRKRRGPTSKGRGGDEREGGERMGGERRGKGEGEREGMKGMAGPIPNPLLRV